ncbi:alpha/beta fold hydrolase [Pseudonocardia sp. TRM90224]|uniref:alpha/beta fold hydrolase n=1 Tax=Pseudonocardia sp. TRM90224 TaxID=2812678 RepID=UPI001E31DA50|nr:alpha/beta fold hydrolase [Pseudonocardia sp. TRM90224]
MCRNPQGRTGSRRRRLIVVAVPVAVAVLLTLNTVLVDRQAAPAGAPGLTVDGEQIHVTQDGPVDAPALVLLHGFSASGRSWDRIVPSLAARHRVIRIDLLGHGSSAKPTGDGYEIGDQAHRVAAVLDQLGVDRAVVAGHSTGGSVATALAELRGDLVAAIVLVNTGPNLDAFIPQGAVNQLLTTPVVGQLLWRFRTESLVRQAAANAVTRDDVEIPQSVVDDVLGLTYHAFVATDQAARSYLRQRPLPERLAALGKPLLVLFGDADRRWRSSSAEDYRVVAGVQVEMLPGVGHSPPIEDPQRTADLLLDFADRYEA